VPWLGADPAEETLEMTPQVALPYSGKNKRGKKKKKKKERKGTHGALSLFFLVPSYDFRFREETRSRCQNFGLRRGETKKGKGEKKKEEGGREGKKVSRLQERLLTSAKKSWDPPCISKTDPVGPGRKGKKRGKKREEGKKEKKQPGWSTPGYSGSTGPAPAPPALALVQRGEKKRKKKKGGGRGK